MGLNLSHGWDMELEHSYTAGRCESKYNHLGNLAISTEDEHTHTHTHQPAVSFLRIYPTEMQTHVYQMTCRTFIVTLFTRVSKWKQPKCLPIEKKDRMWYTSKTQTNSKKYLRCHVHCSIIYSRQDMKVTHVHSDGWMDK